MPAKRKASTKIDTKTPKPKLYSNSITSLNSLSEKNSRIKKGIKDFVLPKSNQIELAEKLKNYYLDNDPNVTWDTISKKDDIDDNQFDFFQKFNIDSEEDYKKQLLFPSTLLQFMSSINNLELENINSNNFSAFQSKILAYFLTIVDTINIKILYVICDGENYYLSPLNIKKVRTLLRKNKINLDHSDIFYLNKELANQYKDFKNKSNYNIDASKYDFVFISNSFNLFNDTTNKLNVYLSNIDLKQHYKASILRNTKHVISINKCNQYNILNTTWKPFNIYNITNSEDNDILDIIKKELYYVDEPEDEFTNQYYYLKHKNEITFNKSLYTINLYSNRATLRTKIYKQLGGTDVEYIPISDICSNLFFPNNLYGYCWFSSIINSLFYSDDIAAIFLNKSIRNMDNTLNFLHEFYNLEKYKTIDFTNQKELKKILKHLIYLMSFIYCSYSILSKNQLDERIINKKKWYEIYEIITDRERYKIIATIILGLSNIK